LYLIDCLPKRHRSSGNPAVSDTTPDFDFVILADRAEVVNGKLYMMGGGWESIGLRRAGDAAAFTIAVGIGVPWLATNVEHKLDLRLEDADGGAMTALGVGFTAGRPATVPQGVSQRLIFALPVQFAFPAAGAYVIACTLGEREQRVPFQVSIVPAAPGVPPHALS